jgi:hypothetical protein
MLLSQLPAIINSIRGRETWIWVGLYLKSYGILMNYPAQDWVEVYVPILIYLNISCRDQSVLPVNVPSTL